MHHTSSSEDSEWVLRSPTYTTAGYLDEPKCLNSLVSVKILKKAEDVNEYNDFTPVQVSARTSFFNF